MAAGLPRQWRKAAVWRSVPQGFRGYQAPNCG